MPRAPSARIIHWDTEQAINAEKPLNLNVLSTVAKAETISDEDAKYLVTQLRTAMKTLPQEYWRLPWAELE